LIELPLSKKGLLLAIGSIWDWFNSFSLLLIGVMLLN
jgi:hypothetical protein